MTAPVRLAMMLTESGPEGPAACWKNGREVLRGTGRDVRIQGCERRGLAPGDEYLITTPTANIRMRLLTREERKAGVRPVLDVKLKRTQPQSDGAAA